MPDFSKLKQLLAQAGITFNKQNAKPLYQPGQYPVADAMQGFVSPEYSAFQQAGNPKPQGNILQQIAHVPNGAMLAADQFLPKARMTGVYVKPTVDGNLLSNDVERIGGPGGIAKYNAIGKSFEYHKQGPDINPMVVGHERGSYTELVPEYTLPNRNYLWGKDKFENARRMKNLDDNILKFNQKFDKQNLPDVKEQFDIAKDIDPSSLSVTPEEHSKIQSDVNNIPIDYSQFGAKGIQDLKNNETAMRLNALQQLKAQQDLDNLNKASEEGTFLQQYPYYKGQK